MIIVDSSVWIDYFNGNHTPQTNTLDDLLGNEPLAIGDLILAEVLQGFQQTVTFKRLKHCCFRFRYSRCLEKETRFDVPRTIVSCAKKGSRYERRLTLSLSVFV